MNKKEIIKDNVLPKHKWEFDKDVADCFDDMLERSIPQYDVMRKSCFDLACQYVKPRTDIVDLGCSRGEAITKLIDKYGALNRFVGLDISDPMLTACRNRFKGLIDCGVVDIRKSDLRNDFPHTNASVMLSVLTIQFTPIEYRQKIIKNIYNGLISGGAFIMVEKVLGSTYEIDTNMIDLYYGLKKTNGYSQDQIERKKCSLEGVLVPLTSKWNEELLKSAGFIQIDCFWRWMNFAGWIAIKE